MKKSCTLPGTCEKFGVKQADGWPRQQGARGHAVLAHTCHMLRKLLQNRLRASSFCSADCRGWDACDVTMVSSVVFGLVEERLAGGSNSQRSAVRLGWGSGRPFVSFPLPRKMR